jgi:tetratricopeptide (TPR) repeat protein
MTYTSRTSGFTARATLWLAIAALIMTATSGYSRGLPLDREIPEVIVSGMTGQQISLSTMKGRALLLICARDDDRSRKAITDIVALFADSSELAERVRVLVVWSGKVDMEAAAPIAKLAHDGLPFAGAFDPEGKAWDALQIVATPTTDFIDDKGVLRTHLPGYPQDYRTQLAKIFRENLGVQMPFPEKSDAMSASAHPAGTTRHIALAQILLRQGRPESACKSLEKARGQWPDDADIATLLGYIYLKLKETDRAKRAFAAVVEKHPGNDDAVTGLAACMIEEGDLAMARQKLIIIESRAPKSPRVLYYLGVIASKDGLHEEAAKRFQAAAEAAIPEL